MITLPAALTTEKNKLKSTSPWVYLFELTLDDSTTARYAAYPEDVTFDGQTYTAIGAVVSARTEDSGNTIPSISVAISNVNRAMSAYLENAKIEGRAVRVRIVHTDHLGDANCKIDLNFRCNRVAVTDDAAVFELGQENLAALRMPMHRYIRTRCRWVYKDDHCGYPGDEFGPCTRQDFADPDTGGPVAKLNGWCIDHPAYGTIDAGITTAGYLTVANVNAGPYGWLDTTHSGAFAYIELTGDFDAETFLDHASIATVNVGVLFLAVSSDSADWVGFRWRCTTGPTQQLARLSTTAGATTATALGSWHQYARLTRVGSLVTWYTKAAAGDSWTQQGQATHTGLDAALRVGFATHSDAVAAVTALRFDYLRVNSGGIASCDYSFDGENGCRAHSNTLRFGGAPTIPRGVLYV